MALLQLGVVFGRLLAVGAAEVSRGQDPENNAVYVWPYLAELPLDGIPAPDLVASDLATLADLMIAAWR